MQEQSEQTPAQVIARAIAEALDAKSWAPSVADEAELIEPFLDAWGTAENVPVYRLLRALASVTRSRATHYAHQGDRWSNPMSACLAVGYGKVSDAIEQAASVAMSGRV